jgi:hypothetical protein
VEVTEMEVAVEAVLASNVKKKVTWQENVQTKTPEVAETVVVEVAVAVEETVAVAETDHVSNVDNKDIGQETVPKKLKMEKEEAEAEAVEAVPVVVETPVSSANKKATLLENVLIQVMTMEREVDLENSVTEVTEVATRDKEMMTVAQEEMMTMLEILAIQDGQTTPQQVAGVIPTPIQVLTEPRLGELLQSKKRTLQVEAGTDPLSRIKISIDDYFIAKKFDNQFW